VRMCMFACVCVCVCGGGGVFVCCVLACLTRSLPVGSCVGLSFPYALLGGWISTRAKTLSFPFHADVAIDVRARDVCVCARALLTWCAHDMASWGCTHIEGAGASDPRVRGRRHS
jgi:hypothetical protein